MTKYTIALALLLLCGCFSFKFGDAAGSSSVDSCETVLLANSNNVYRLSEETVMKVKVQGADGKWVESKRRVVVPADWYIVCGEGDLAK